MEKASDAADGLSARKSCQLISSRIAFSRVVFSLAMRSKSSRVASMKAWRARVRHLRPKTVDQDFPNKSVARMHSADFSDKGFAALKPCVKRLDERVASVVCASAGGALDRESNRYGPMRAHAGLR